MSKRKLTKVISFRVEEQKAAPLARVAKAAMLFAFEPGSFFDRMLKSGLDDEDFIAANKEELFLRGEEFEDREFEIADFSERLNDHYERELGEH